MFFLLFFPTQRKTNSWKKENTQEKQVCWAFVGKLSCNLPASFAYPSTSPVPPQALGCWCWSQWSHPSSAGRTHHHPVWKQTLWKHRNQHSRKNIRKQEKITEKNIRKPSCHPCWIQHPSAASSPPPFAWASSPSAPPTFGDHDSAFLLDPRPLIPENGYFENKIRSDMKTKTKTLWNTVSSLRRFRSLLRGLLEEEAWVPGETAPGKITQKGFESSV